MQAGDLVQRETSVLTRRISPEMVFVADKVGRVSVLRGDAARTWLELHQPATAREVASRVARVKGLGTDRIAPKVYRLLGHLETVGLAIIIPSGEPGGAEYAPAQPRPGAEGPGMGMPEAQRQDTLNDICISLGVPIRVQLDLTYACNLRCKHCYADETMMEGRTRPGDLLHLDRYREVIGELADAGAFLVRLSGGEPLLSPILEPVLAELQRHQFCVTVVTNGTGIDEAKAGLLKAYGIRGVSVSLHGARAETHDGFAQREGAFRRAVSGIRNLIDAGVPVSITHVVTRHNWRETPDVIRMAREFGIPIFVSPIVRPTSQGSLQPAEHRMTQEQLDSFVQMTGYRSTKLTCNLGWKVVVEPNGDVYSCDLVPESAGNLRDMRFADIWRGPVFQKWRTLQDYRLPPKVCQECPLSSTCHRCPAIAYYETGSLAAPDPEACRISKTAAKYAEVR